MTRVGVVGPAGEDDFAANIYAGLQDLNVNATLLGPPTSDRFGRRGSALLQTLRRDPRLGPRIERGIVAQALDHEVNLVITVVSLRPETVRALRSKGIRVALWFPDHVAQLGALWMFDAPYNGIFFKEPVLVRNINSILELPVHYLPEACNPKIHRPVPSSEAAGTVAVVGNLHPIRARLLERLVSDGIPIRIYGPSWHSGLHSSLQGLHAGRYLRGTDKAAVFGSASAVLNNLHPAELEGVNCRLFEATAAAGAVVMDHRAALEDHFELGSEVLAYRSYNELVTHLRSLLESDVLGKAMGRVASARCLSNYSYAIRLQSLLGHVL